MVAITTRASIRSHQSDVPSGSWRRPRGCVYPARMATRSILERIDGLDWREIGEQLAERGWARTPRLLTAAEARGLVALYRNDERFRSALEPHEVRL